MIGQKVHYPVKGITLILHQVAWFATALHVAQISCYASGQLDKCTTMPVSLAVPCVEGFIHPQSGTGASIRVNRPDACKTLWELRQFQSAQTQADDSASKMEGKLTMACSGQLSVGAADRLFAKGRYDDAKTLYNAIVTKQADSELNWVFDRATRGNLACIESKNYFELPASLVALERQGRFEKAEAEAKRSLPEADAHRKHLVQFLGLIKETAELERRGEANTALTGFNSYKSSLDPTRDQYLFSAALDQIARLEPLARMQNNLDALSLLAVGDTEVKHGQYADAEASYNRALTNHPDNINPAIAVDAGKKLSEVRRLKADEPSFIGTLRNFSVSVRKFFLDLLVWTLEAVVLVLLLAVVIALTWWCSARIRNRTKPGIFLSIKEISSTATDLGNQLLSEQMRREIDLPIPQNPDEPVLGNTNTRLRISNPGEMQGSSIGQAGILVPLHDVDTIFQSAAQITFGSFSINPVQIFNLIKPFFRRRYQLELDGTLSQLGESVVCSVSIASGSFPNMQGRGPWEAVWSGADQTDNRNQAIRDCTSQILIAIDSKTRDITAYPRSLAYLQIGIGLLQRASYDLANQLDLWKEAREAFQQSVLQDPGNWLARFNLGTVLRNLDFNSLAAEQFAELLLTKSVQKNAELTAVANYNRAAALQKVDDEDVSKEVIATFDGILKTPGLDPTLVLLARSAMLAAEADSKARTKRFLLGIGVDPSHKIRRAELNKLFGDGEELCKEIEK